MGTLWRTTLGTQNQAPVITIPSSVQIAPGQTVSVASWTVDPEGQVITYAQVGSGWTNGISFNAPTAQIAVLSNAAPGPRTNLQFSATDASGAITTSTLFTVTVTNLNPVWQTSIPTQNISGSGTFNLSTYVSDPGDTLTYSWQSVPVSGVTLNTASGLVTVGSTTVAGSYGMRFNAIDSGGNTVVSPLITVVVTSVSLPFRIVNTGVSYATLDAAASAAVDSTTTVIEVQPGTYTPATFAGFQLYRNVTLRCSVVGQKATFASGGVIPGGGNALFNLGGAAGKTIVIEDCEFTGNKFASVANAGLTWFAQNTTITLRRCNIYGNSNGILTSNTVTSGSLTLENCNIYDNGDGTPEKHHLYIGSIDSLTVRGCHIRNKFSPSGGIVQAGHLIKSRARTNLIEANRITMENNDAPNRNIDISNGGDCTIRGNLIEYYSLQNGGASQAIAWGVEGTNGLPGNVFEASRVHNLRIYQNTIVNRNPAGEHPIWVGTGANSGLTVSLTPAPTLYDVKDNVFAGWMHNPPRVKDEALGPVNANSTTYGISVSNNTSGPLSTLTAATTYDYSLVTPVIGSQNWAPYQYTHPITFLARTDSYRGAVVPNIALRSWITGNGTWVDGASPGAPTYTTLTALKATINSATGGMAQIANTRLVDYAMSNALMDSISHPNVLRAVTGSNAGSLMAAWGSAGFDGKSFILGCVGGHTAYWGTEMYRVRFTDPPAACRMYDAFPSEWANLDNSTTPSNSVAQWIAWGGSIQHVSPLKAVRASHQYDCAVCAPNGVFVCAGSNQFHYEQQSDLTFRVRMKLGIFDPNAATPDAAWTALTVNPVLVNAPGQGFTLSGGWGPESAVVLDDGRVMIEVFSGITYDGTGLILDPITKTASLYSSGTPYPRWQFSQKRGGWIGKGTNGTWYHIDSNTPSSGTETQSAVYRANNTKVFGPLPTWWHNAVNMDQRGGKAIVGNKIVFWNATNHLGMLDVTTGVFQETQYSSYTVTRPPIAHNGTFGRFAYLSAVNAFVGLSSETQNAHLIVPPASWGIGS